MPILDTLIPETTKQMIEPISEQIARRLLSIMGMFPLFKDNLFVTSDDLKASNFKDKDHDNRIQDNRCEVKITPNFNPVNTIWEGFRSKDEAANINSYRWTFGEYPIFSDPRPNIYLFEVDVPCSVELAFTLKVKSVELADIINNALFSKSMVNGAVYDYNDVLFSYPIPDRVLILLHKMYSMQDDLEAIGSFPEYLTSGSNSAITIMLNRDKLDDGPKEVIVQRSNVRVLGRLDYTGDKPETEDVNKVANRYVINFTYSYQFSRPALLRLNYPIMVNNSLLESRFVRRPQSMSIGEGPRVYPNRAINMYFYRQNENTLDLTKSYPLVQYPEHDDWQRESKIYKNIITQYPAVFIGLMSVDVDATSGACSLSVDIRNEIFPMLPEGMADAIEAVMAHDFGQDSITDIMRRLSIFDFAVFSNDNVIDHTKISIDEDLILRVNTPVDITKRYRVVISMIRDFKVLNYYYIHYMLNNPDYYIDLLAFNIKYLIEYKFVRVVVDRTANTKQIVTGSPNTQIPAGGFRYGIGRAIDLGRYIIEVRRK